MALLSGRGSSLNPNARPFIPAVYRQVEDFSSEWWNLVQNSTWFRDYWMSKHQQTNFEELIDTKEDDDITNLLPDTFDFGYDEFPCADVEYEDSIRSFKTYDGSSLRPEFKPQNGLGLDTEALIKNINISSLSQKGRSTSQLVERARCEERPLQRMNFNHGTRRVHQPR